MKQRLRALGDRWPWFGRALDVQDRFGEINGGFAASAITITVFLAIFPLLLVVVSVIGYLNAGNADLASDLIEKLDLTGPAARTLTDALDTASQSRQAASIIGLLGLAWAGSALAVALQEGVRLPWQERSQGLKDRFVGIGWLVVAFVGLALLLAASGVLAFLPSWVPVGVAAALSVVVNLAVSAVFFAWLFWGLGTRRMGWRHLLPGALVAAVGFEVLGLIGTVYVPQLVSRSSALYGSIGIVFAILAWLALFARLLVYASTLNAVLYEAREGTVEVPIHVPRLPGLEPVAATRGGIALAATDDPPAVPT